MTEIAKAILWLVSTPFGWSVLVIVVAISFIACHAYYIEYNKNNEKLENIINHPGPVEENTDKKYEDFNALSNKELRDAALDLAKNMYSFAANHMEAVHNSLHRSLPNYATEDQQNAAWEKKQISFHQHCAKFSTEFMTRYRPDAVAIRHEMASRLGIFPPYENLDDALDRGMLTGANPVANAADLISELARRLS